MSDQPVMRHKVVRLFVTEVELERWLDSLRAGGGEIVSLNLQQLCTLRDKSTWIAVIAAPENG